MKKIISIVSILIVLQGCTSVTMRPYGGEKDIRKPDYAVSKTFWFWGLKGEHEVNVNTVCGKRRVTQMQTVMTLSDFARGLITLFIYAPRTAKVWCESEQPVQQSSLQLTKSGDFS